MSASQGASAALFDQQAVPLPPLQRGLTEWPVTAVPARKAAVSITMVNRPDPRQRVFHLDWEKDELRRSYIFSSEASVWLFLVAHSAIRTTLRDALPHLQASFGRDRIFCLQLSREEDGSLFLHAVVIWPDSVQSAVHALRQFEEDWWLDRMTPATAELAFVYEIA